MNLQESIERTVTAMRREHLDVSAAWAEMLTDEARLRAAFAKHAPDALAVFPDHGQHGAGLLDFLLQRLACRGVVY